MDDIVIWIVFSISTAILTVFFMFSLHQLCCVVDHDNSAALTRAASIAFMLFLILINHILYSLMDYYEIWGAEVGRMYLWQIANIAWAIELLVTFYTVRALIAGLVIKYVQPSSSKHRL